MLRQPEFPRALLLLKVQPSEGGLSLPWEPVRNAEPQGLPQTHLIRFPSSPEPWACLRVSRPRLATARVGNVTSRMDPSTPRLRQDSLRVPSKASALGFNIPGGRPARRGSVTPRHTV